MNLLAKLPNKVISLRNIMGYYYRNNLIITLLSFEAKRIY